MQKKACLTALAIGAAAVLAGCGGGVQDSGNAEGAWYTIKGNPATQMVILSNGTLWGIYGSDATVAGVQGMLRGSADTYISNDCLNYFYSYDDDGNYVQGDCSDWVQYPTASGSLTQFDMSGNAAPAIDWYFSGLAQEAATLAITLGHKKNQNDGPDLALLYDDSYDTAASVATFAGAYAGWAAVSGQTRHNLSGITISGSTLTVPADDSGCSATGTLAPHKGKGSSTGDASNATVGVLDVSLTFNGAGCVLGSGTTVKGITIPPNNTVSGSAQLQIVTATSDKQNGFMLVANRE
jgi:hypothetical protein